MEHAVTLGRLAHGDGERRGKRAGGDLDAFLGDQPLGLADRGGRARGVAAARYSIFRPLTPPRSLIMSRAICIASQFSMPFFAKGPVTGSSTPIRIGCCAPAKSSGHTMALIPIRQKRTRVQKRITLPFPSAHHTTVLKTSKGRTMRQRTRSRFRQTLKGQIRETIKTSGCQDNKLLPTRSAQVSDGCCLAGRRARRGHGGLWHPRNRRRSRRRNSRRRSAHQLVRLFDRRADFLSKWRSRLPQRRLRLLRQRIHVATFRCRIHHNLPNIGQKSQLEQFDIAENAVRQRFRICRA